MWYRGKTYGIFNRILAHIDSTLIDHGIFRIFWRSWYELPGNMFRSNQPYPFQLKKSLKKYKIKSIINLRGKRHCSSFYLEKEFCEINKIKIYNFPMSSRDLPEKKQLLNFNKLVNTVEYPCLMHCKSGADRAGIASVLYLIFKKNYSIIKASKQLSFKFLHIKYSKTGILDYFFSELVKMGINDNKNFLKWINNDYNKKSLKKGFKVNTILNFIINLAFKRE